MIDFFTKILGWFLIRKLGDLLQEQDPLTGFDKNTISEILDNINEVSLKADAETKRLLGLPPKFSKQEDITNFDEYLDTLNKVTDKYYDEIKTKYNLTEKQWEKIFGDKFLEQWNTMTPEEKADWNEAILEAKKPSNKNK